MSFCLSYSYIFLQTHNAESFWQLSFSLLLLYQMSRHPFFPSWRQTCSSDKIILVCEWDHHLPKRQIGKSLDQCYKTFLIRDLCAVPVTICKLLWCWDYNLNDPVYTNHWHCAKIPNENILSKKIPFRKHWLQHPEHKI